MQKHFYKMLSPIYPLLAQQFVDDYNLKTGKCVDIGTGPGLVGIEVAKITDMEIYFVDIDDEKLKLAEKNYEKAECDNEVHFVESDVHQLNFDNDFIDFIVSRGSIWFWEEPVYALKEVYRVLKPGGIAIIGGGLGRYIPETMRKRLTEANKKRLVRRGENRPSYEEFKSMVDRANLPRYRIIFEGSSIGRWVEIKK